MLKIDVDVSAAMRKVQAVVKNAENYKKSKFSEKVIKILDENVLPQTPIDTHQLYDGTTGRVEGDTVIYGPTGPRAEGGTNEEVAYHLENSHGGRDAYLFAAYARSARQIEQEVGADIKAEIKGSWP